MKNILVLILFIAISLASIATEPISDSADIIAGATNSTYNTEIDLIAGASDNNQSSEPSEPSVDTYGG
ncbi:MAG: hypothetical protein CVV57_00705 [Tenericutes bacterium HGW-Tenericutes-2]|jgi:hypothetical protein|nr:MAG: hypothetical protein CVV57_00705 [Tenericutes bacterium HGW-Tenericutes-2]